VDGIATALLDIDGTLVDSNDAHARAWVDALTVAGYVVDVQSVRPLIGMGADRLLPAIDRDLRADTEPGQTIAEHRSIIFRSIELPRLRPMPGARELLLALRRHGVRRTIATSATREEARALLKVAAGEDLVDDVVTGDDAPRAKPAPDIVIAALRTSSSRADEAVMIGDTAYDIDAAAAAGVATIALRCGGASEADLAGSSATFDDPASLADELGRRSLAEILGPRGVTAPAFDPRTIRKR
jgi:HAD superfamily hydrolase (TIGR01509 family)